MITIENVKSKIEDLKEQKLEFINEEESEKILLREGFYFIDKYKSIFLKNNLVSEEYQDDTKFEYLYYLYYFDNELKSTLFKFILMVENRLKTKLVIFYPNSREEIFNLMFNELKNFIRERKNENEISEMVNALKNDFKTEYPNLNLEITPEDLIEILEFIRGFRNICAHNERLYNHRFTANNINSFIIHEHYSLNFNYGLFDLILILKFFITQLEYSALKSLLTYSLAFLSLNVDESDFIKILNKMKFPKNWEEILEIKEDLQKAKEFYQNNVLLNKK